MHCSAACLLYQSRWLACCRCLNAGLVAYCFLVYARILSWRAALNSGSSAYLRFKYLICLLYFWPRMCWAVIKFEHPIRAAAGSKLLPYLTGARW